MRRSFVPRFIPPAGPKGLAITAFCLTLLGALLTGSAALAQDPPIPADLALHLEAGSVGPDHDLYIFDLDAGGNGTLCLVTPRDRETAQCTSVSQHLFSPDEVAQLWALIQEVGFFDQAPSQIADVVDGTFAELEITADGNTHTVLTQNLELPAVDDIVVAIDASLPADSKIIYNAIFDRV